MIISTKKRKWRKNSAKRCHYHVIVTPNGEVISSSYRIRHTYKSLYTWMKNNLHCIRPFAKPLNRDIKFLPTKEQNAKYFDGLESNNDAVAGTDGGKDKPQAGGARAKRRVPTASSLRTGNLDLPF